MDMLSHGTVDSVEHTLRCIRGDIALREQDLACQPKGWAKSEEGRAFVSELNRVRAVADYLEGLLPARTG